MAKIDLNLYTTATKDGDQYKIADIPPKLWAQFTERAKVLMPERGDDAWSAFLSNAIASVCDGDSHTFIMTDIPANAKNSLDDACESAKVRADQVIGQIFKSAMDGKFHLLNITDFTQVEDTHTLVIVGLPDKAWQGWDAVAQQANVETEYLLGMFFEAAASGSLNFKGDPGKRPGNIPEYKANGNGTSSGQSDGEGLGRGARTRPFTDGARQSVNGTGRSRSTSTTTQRKS